jgi:formylglycine-generating enzyme required for sulfatase activity
MKFVPVPGTKGHFCIHETRYKDYAAFVAETPGVDGAWKSQSSDGYTATDRADEHPVWKVSWDDAQGFCAWLSKKEGRAYRLPTDKE